MLTPNGLDGSGIDFLQGQEVFSSPKSSRPTLGPTKFLIQWLEWLFPGGKRAEAWSWLLSFVDVGKYSFVNRTIKSWNQLSAGLLASFSCKINTFRKRVKNVVTSKGIQEGLSVNRWSDVKCSDVEWTDVIYVKWFCFEVKWSEVKWSEVKWSEVKWSEVKWVTVKFLGIKVPCTLR